MKFYCRKSSPKMLSCLVKRMNLETTGEVFRDNSESNWLVKSGINPEFGYIAYNMAGRPIGWAIAFSGQSHTVHVFVMPRYRQKGVGTRLLKLMLKKQKTLRCKPWDHVSRKFFKNTSSKLNKNLDGFGVVKYIS